MKMKAKFLNLLLVFIVMANVSHSQVSTPSNSNGISSDYLGWDATVTGQGNTAILEINHLGNQPIIFSTGTIERMRLDQTTGMRLQSFSTARSHKPLFSFLTL
jgi:hypothetical protein